MDMISGVNVISGKASIVTVNGTGKSGGHSKSLGGGLLGNI